MNKEKIATTYEEYKNGAKQVAGFGRLGCYQGLDYLEKLLENDKYYSEQLEDSIVFIESHINSIEKQNKKYKEVIDKLNKYLHTRAIKKCYNGTNYCGFDGLQAKVFEDILKEVE